MIEVCWQKVKWMDRPYHKLCSAALRYLYMTKSCGIEFICPHCVHHIVGHACQLSTTVQLVRHVPLNKLPNIGIYYQGRLSLMTLQSHLH